MPRIPEASQLETQIRSGATSLRPAADLGPAITAATSRLQSQIAGVGSAFDARAERAAVQAAVKLREAEAQTARIQKLRDVKLTGQFINSTREENDAIAREAGDLSDPNVLKGVLSATAEAQARRDKDFVTAGGSEFEAAKFSAFNSARGFEVTKQYLDGAEAATKQHIMVNSTIANEHIQVDVRDDPESVFSQLKTWGDYVGNVSATAIDIKERDGFLRNGSFNIISQSIKGAMEQDDFELALAIATSQDVEDLLPQSQIDDMRDIIANEHEKFKDEQKAANQAGNELKKMQVKDLVATGDATDGLIESGLAFGFTGTQASEMKVTNEKNRVKRIKQEEFDFEATAAASSRAPFSVDGRRPEYSEHWRTKMRSRWAGQVQRGEPMTFWSEVENFAFAVGELPPEAYQDLRGLLDSPAAAASMDAAIHISEFAKLLPNFPDDQLDAQTLIRANVMVSQSTVVGIERARQAAAALVDMGLDQQKVRADELLNANSARPDESLAHLSREAVEARVRGDIANINGFFGGLRDGSFNWWGTQGSPDITSEDFLPNDDITLAGQPAIDSDTTFPPEAWSKLYRNFQSNYIATDGDSVAALNIAITNMMSGRNGFAVDRVLQSALPPGIEVQTNKAMKMPPAMSVPGVPINFIGADLAAKFGEINASRGPDAEPVQNEVVRLEAYHGGAPLIGSDGKNRPTYQLIDKDNQPIMAPNAAGEFVIVRFAPPTLADYQASTAGIAKADAAARAAEAQFDVDNPNATELFSVLRFENIGLDRGAMSAINLIGSRANRAGAGQKAFNDSLGRETLSPLSEQLRKTGENLAKTADDVSDVAGGGLDALIGFSAALRDQ